MTDRTDAQSLVARLREGPIMLEQWASGGHTVEGEIDEAATAALMREAAGTLERLAVFDGHCCIPRADEPFFVLLGRDKQAPAAVEKWASDREVAKPGDDKIAGARTRAAEMRAYSGASAPPPQTDSESDALIDEIATAFCCEPLVRGLCELKGRHDHPNADSYGEAENITSVMGDVHGLVQEHVAKALARRAAAPAPAGDDERERADLVERYSKAVREREEYRANLIAVEKEAATAETRGMMRAADALKWAMDEIDVLSNKLSGMAYPQGMAIGRQDQWQAYRSAVEVRAAASQPAAQPDATDETWEYLDFGGEWVQSSKAYLLEKAKTEGWPIRCRSAQPDATPPVPRGADHPEVGYSEWLPIEGARKDGTYYLMRRKNRRPFVGWWEKGTGNQPSSWTDGYAHRDPTAFKLIFPDQPLAPEPSAEVEWRVSEERLRELIEEDARIGRVGERRTESARMAADLRAARAALARRPDPTIHFFGSTDDATSRLVTAKCGAIVGVTRTSMQEDDVTCALCRTSRPDPTPATPVIDETRERLKNNERLLLGTLIGKIIAEHDAALACCPGGYREGWIAGRDAAAVRAHRFQDVVGFQPGESRNELIGGIEEAIRVLTPPAENEGGARMTPPVPDLDAMQAAAEAALDADTWSYDGEGAVYTHHREVARLFGLEPEVDHRGNHIAAWSPANALAVLGMLREAEAEIKQLIHDRALRDGAITAMRDRWQEDIARAEKAEARVAELEGRGR